MAIIQKFDLQKGLIFVVWQGTVTAQEWFRYAHKLTSDSTWTTASRVLADLLSVQSTSSIQNQEIDQAVEIFSANRAGLVGKKLAVLARDEFGKARRFGEYLSHFGTSSVVFNNLDTACLFLGMDILYAYRMLDSMHGQSQSD